MPFSHPSLSPISRRTFLGVAASGPLFVALAPQAEAQVAESASLQASAKLDADGGSWRPWLVPSGAFARPPAPSGSNSAKTVREIKELLRLQNDRGDAARQVVATWDALGGVTVWTKILLDTIKATSTNPVAASRAIALVHTAMADAAIASWNAKFRYRRRSPERTDLRIRSISRVNDQLPTYASEHAAIAAAAATVLSYLYPGQTYVLNRSTFTFDGLANQAAYSRLLAGANFRSDLDAGFAIGEVIGRQAVVRGQTDGSANSNPVTAPVGPQFWVSTANPAAAPLLPRAGQWNSWVMDQGNQFRLPDPAVYVNGAFTEGFLREVQAVKDAATNLTDPQKQIANFWADNPGVSFTPPGHWTELAAGLTAARPWSAVRAARAMAMVGVGVADAAIACWDTKFTHWLLRPVTAIRTIQGQAFTDPTWSSFIGTPNFPAFTSGHSSFSGCSATVLDHLFPNGRVMDALGQQITFVEAAEQAALSRLYGGIHYPIDNNAGLTCGQSVGGLVIARGRRDGA